jgi:hypothetical protein
VAEPVLAASVKAVQKRYGTASTSPEIDAVT